MEMIKSKPQYVYGTRSKKRNHGSNEKSVVEWASGPNPNKKPRLSKKKNNGSDSDDESESEGEEDTEGMDKLKEIIKNKLKNTLLGGKDDDDDSTCHGKKNHIYFDNYITQKSARKLINKIDEMSMKLKKLHVDYDINDPPKIYLHISSMGGSIFDAFNVIDTIMRSKIPIVTIIEGASASAATLISISGHERWITEHGYMLIHQLSSTYWGKMKMEEIEDEYHNLKELTARLIDHYAKRTTMTKKQLTEFFKHDRWWDAKKCLERGLVDKIWTGDETQS